MKTTTFFGETVGDRAQEEWTTDVWFRHVFSGPLAPKLRAGRVVIRYPFQFFYLDSI